MPPTYPPVPITEPQVVVLIDSGAPAVLPWKIKQLYIDKDNGNIYQATGLEASSWVQLTYSTGAPT